jgi:hypothetical protein
MEAKQVDMNTLERHIWKKAMETPDGKWYADYNSKYPGNYTPERILNDLGIKEHVKSYLNNLLTRKKLLKPGTQRIIYEKLADLHASYLPCNYLYLEGEKIEEVLRLYCLSGRLDKAYSWLEKRIDSGEKRYQVHMDNCRSAKEALQYPQPFAIRIETEEEFAEARYHALRTLENKSKFEHARARLTKRLEQIAGGQNGR